MRHERDVVEGFESAQLDEHLHVIAERDREIVRFVLLELIKAFVKSDFGQYLQRRRMHGVAAEIAQEILVLFEHRHANARACEQESEHHSRRTTADDATFCGNVFSGHSQFPLAVK